MGTGKNSKLMSTKNTTGVPLKEEITNQQVGPVLDIIRELTPFILEEVRAEGAMPLTSSLDGGVQCAAQSTFIRACSRLDAILGDDSRWHMKSMNTLVAEMVKTHKAQQKFIAAQEASSANLQAPHFLLRPTLAISGGKYYAYWGNIHEAGQAIVGQGTTPNEALLDFDAAFERTPENQILLVAEKAGIKMDKPTE